MNSDSNLSLYNWYIIGHVIQFTITNTRYKII